MIKKEKAQMVRLLIGSTSVITCIGGIQLISETLINTDDCDGGKSKCAHLENSLPVCFNSLR